MQYDDDMDDVEFPVLNDVVQPGDPSLIATLKTIRKSLNEIPSNHNPETSPQNLSQSELSATHADFNSARNKLAKPLASNEQATNKNGSEQTMAKLKTRVDDIIDRHIRAMRLEIDQLFKDICN